MDEDSRAFRIPLGEEGTKVLPKRASLLGQSLQFGEVRPPVSFAFNQEGLFCSAYHIIYV